MEASDFIDILRAQARHTQVGDIYVPPGTVQRTLEEHLKDNHEPVGVGPKLWITVSNQRKDKLGYCTSAPFNDRPYLGRTIQIGETKMVALLGSTPFITSLVQVAWEDPELPANPPPRQMKISSLLVQLRWAEQVTRVIYANYAYYRRYAALQWGASRAIPSLPVALRIGVPLGAEHYQPTVEVHLRWGASGGSKSVFDVVLGKHASQHKNVFG